MAYLLEAGGVPWCQVIVCDSDAFKLRGGVRRNSQSHGRMVNRRRYARAEYYIHVPPSFLNCLFYRLLLVLSLAYLPEFQIFRPVTETGKLHGLSCVFMGAVPQVLDHSVFHEDMIADLVLILSPGKLGQD